MKNTTLLHLSDLHFRSRGITALTAWQILRAWAKTVRPDILVVTGDLADSPRRRCVDLAYEQVCRLGEELDLPFPIDDVERERGILVLPGNHDVRQIGNFLQTRRHWNRTFGEHLLRGVWLRRRNLVLYAFDSCNPGSGLRKLAPLARGAVGDAEIGRFLDWCAEQSGGPDGEAFARALKIAMLHHHPLPIADAEIGRGGRLQKYTAMDDGGRILKVLAQHRFGVVLHGHDHCPQVAKLQTGAMGDWDPGVLVVAGGSACCPGPPPRSGYAANVIKLSNEGTIRLMPHVRHSADFELTCCQTIDYSGDRHRNAVTHRLKRIPIRFQSITKSVSVDETGHARIHLCLLDGMVESNADPIVAIPLRLPRAIPGGRELGGSHIRAAITAKGQERRRVLWESGEQQDGLYMDGVLRFTEQLARDRGPYTIDVFYSIPNAMITTEEHHKLIYGHNGKPDRREYISLPLDVVADALVLEVRFLKSRTPARLATHELAQLPRQHPLDVQALVGRDGLGNEEKSDATWPLRCENQIRMPCEEGRDRLRVEEDRSDDTLKLKLHAMQPFPGARYYLSWRLPSLHKCIPKDHAIDRQLRHAEGIRDILRAQRADLARPLEQQILGPFLKSLRDLLLESEFAAQKVGEKLEVGIAVFDPDDRRLRWCCGDFDASAEDLAEEEFMAGEGVVGHSFKMRLPVLWWRPFDFDPAAEACFRYKKPPGYKRPHEAVLAVPLLYPLDVPAMDQNPEEPGTYNPEAWRYVIGVLVFRSTASGTVLLDLRNDDETDNTESPAGFFVDLVWTTFVQQELPALPKLGEIQA